MRRLREQFPNELVIISVHSAKFSAEKLTENIRAAVMRHGIHNPVVNDANFAIWNHFAVRAWPTVVLIDPAGKVVGQQSGELDAEAFAPIFAEMLADFANQGLLNRTPIAGLRPAELDEPVRRLSFPAKLLHAVGDRLFVADTGHHRLLEVQLSADGLSGEVVRTFGTGEAGLCDGSIQQAKFHAPHGLALSGNTLYVADTENHAIRAIDLLHEQVRTIAGTGELGRGRSSGGQTPTTMNLRSPWAVLAEEKLLLIAMAGTHQIWLQTGDRLTVFAGNGAEVLQDGPRAEASFNQPSDLALAWGYLFVADPEASAIRAIALGDDQQVMTLVGQGLFEWGDVDGAGPAVRLQHPTGLAAGEHLLYIADSYNHKIKTLDPLTGEVQTLIGTGQPGARDGDFLSATLYEPEGLAVAGDKLYIADTNNHLIRVADLVNRKLTTLQLI